jgi:hypothetical protein
MDHAMNGVTPVWYFNVEKHFNAVKHFIMMKCNEVMVICARSQG